MSLHSPPGLHTAHFFFLSCLSVHFRPTRYPRGFLARRGLSKGVGEPGSCRPCAESRVPPCVLSRAPPPGPPPPRPVAAALGGCMCVPLSWTLSCSTSVLWFVLVTSGSHVARLDPASRFQPQRACTLRAVLLT